MKVAMVNDCAYVGETLIKYLPNSMNVNHMKRTRKFLDKTVKLIYNVMRSKGDLFHIHYLLQDCYIALKFKKHPLIGHAHGSDLREEIRGKKLGWMVKYNLKNCDKILVAQPTILRIAKKFNTTAEYFPIPFDPAIFYPKRLSESEEEKKIFLASAHNFKVKGTDKFIQALSSISTKIKVRSIGYGKDLQNAQKLAKKLDIDIEFIDPVQHEKMNELYWESDLVLGSFGIGQLDTVAIEAMASGRPVVHSVLKNSFESCPLEELRTIDDATNIIQELLRNDILMKNRVAKQLEYVNSKHSAPILAERLKNIYNEVLSNY